MNPLITDQQIVALRKSRTTISVTPEYAWQDGAHDLRELYEQERTKLHGIAVRMAGFIDHLPICAAIQGASCNCGFSSLLADYNALTKP